MRSPILAALLVPAINVYGERVDAKRLLQESPYPVPPEARGLVELLSTSWPRRGPEG